MNAEARQVIAALGLEPLPREGGFFRVTWRSEAGSAIYFLLTDGPEGFSALHRLRRDELWHFHAGDPVEQVHIQPVTGELRRIVLGADIIAGQQPQVVAPAWYWQGSRLHKSGGGRVAHGWALVSCTLAPPWQEGESEFAERGTLLRMFPAHAEIVRALTRDQGLA